MSMKIGQYVTGNTIPRCAKIKTLVSYYYPFRRKEGIMKTFPIPGDPQMRSAFLPDVSRS